MPFKIESWKFQHLFEKAFFETSQNVNSIRQLIKKWKNNGLNELNDLKFFELSQNFISNRCWKFQLSFLKNRKVLILKKYFLAVVSKYAKVDPKDGACCPNFQWRFWPVEKPRKPTEESRKFRMQLTLAWCLKLF